jgi:hypothetical protein
MEFNFLQIPVKSEVCLTPETCYPVKTFIPSWITLILIGSVFLLVKNFSSK